MKTIKKWQDVPRSEAGWANWPVLMQREIDELRSALAAPQAQEQATPMSEPVSTGYEMTAQRAEDFMRRFKSEEKLLGPHEQMALDFVIAMLEADAQQVTVPPGYALVPIEPTPDMLAAYLVANTEYWQRTDELPKSNPSRWRSGTPSEATAESYKAMLKAAPQPPKGEVK